MKLAPTLSPEVLHARLAELLEVIPAFRLRPMSVDAHRWLATATALVEETGDLADVLDMKGAVQRIVVGAVTAGDSADMVRAILHRALARTEVSLPLGAQGAFIPAGNVHQAYAAVAKVLGSARIDVLIVDPYADAKLPNDFAGLAPEGVRIRILTDGKHKDTLRSAAERWLQQHGNSRPLEVRISAAPLHDRLIVVDDAIAWTSGQSFKDLAVHSPTSISKTPPDVAKSKIDAFKDIWSAATQI